MIAFSKWKKTEQLGSIAINPPQGEDEEASQQVNGENVSNNLDETGNQLNNK